MANILNLTISKILIIQTAFAGDVILTTPLIHAAKSRFPHADIHFLAIPTTVNALENNSNLKHIWIYDKRKKDVGVLRFLQLANKMRHQKYDLVLSPHRSMRSALLSYLCHSPIRIGFDKSTGSFLFTHKIPYIQNMHEIDRNLSLIEVLGVHVKKRNPEIFPDANDRATVNQFLYRSHGDKELNTVVIAPGSVWPTKRWPKDYFVQISKKFANLNKSVFLIGGEEDANLCDYIVQSAGKNMYNAAGYFTLRQSYELLKQSQLIITNDSAPLHLAAAAGTPTVAIFGPTVPEFGFYPYQKNSRVVQKNLSCRPCSIHGGKKCPIGTHECMLGILPEQIFQTALELLQNGNKI